jgi:hypothetical protein
MILSPFVKKNLIDLETARAKNTTDPVRELLAFLQTQ